MQVSAHTWQASGSSRQRGSGGDSASSLAVDRVDDRTSGKRGGASRGGSNQSNADTPTERTGHKKVFMARTLSSTLTALHLASVSSPAADGDAESAVPAGQTSDHATSLESASLDELLSGFLSAA